MDTPGKETPRRPMPLARPDVVVVGAGPYGLSAAAHLRRRGLSVAVFGKPLELWREHMPRGMQLRSHPWSSNLSDPDRRFSFMAYFRELGIRPGYPVPLETFLEYARWFQEHAVPEIDETYVTRIERCATGFRLTLADGRGVETNAVVMAVGLRYFAHRPEEFRGLPPDHVSHSSDLRDLEPFQGRRVVVIGAGQSAVEYAALLHETGARVHLVSRHPIVWLEPDRAGQRGLLERIWAPDSGIGPGWKNWILEHLPHVFYYLPARWKEKALAYYSGAWASDWLRDRIDGRVKVHEGRVTVASVMRDGRVALTLSSGETIQADHVVLATGYKVDIQRIPILAPTLRDEIQAEGGTPILGPSFESSVPGLYFIGITSMRFFGPLFRFVLGCRPAARRVARGVARRRRASRDGVEAALRHRRQPIPTRRPRVEEPHPLRGVEDEP